jgi:hypothetical protein
MISRYSANRLVADVSSLAVALDKTASLLAEQRSLS